MQNFTKLAGFLNSFGKDHPSYDYVSFIKTKIAQDLQDTNSVNNGNEEGLEDNDVTMATAKQQSQDNHEGELMSGAFKELDVLNKIQDEKDEIAMPGRQDKDGKTQMDMSTEEAFGDNALNQKHATLYDILKSRFRK